jgi:hypothetical protein
MESVKYPAGWYDEPDTEHHPLCRSLTSKLRACNCYELIEGDKSWRAEP